MESQQEQHVIANHIEHTAGVRSGKPRIKGTRITVADVVLWTEQGMSPDQVVTEFPQIGLADVHAALAYYHDNRAAIDNQIRDSRRFADNLKTQLATASDTPATDADGNPISS